MIYLKKTKGDKISASIQAKRDGAYSPAVYDSETDRIIILKSDHEPQEMTNILSHEFMHRILYRSGLEKASLMWDSGFAGHIERWLGWLGPAERMIEDLIWFVKKRIRIDG